MTPSNRGPKIYKEVQKASEQPQNQWAPLAKKTGSAKTSCDWEQHIRTLDLPSFQSFFIHVLTSPSFSLQQSLSFWITDLGPRACGPGAVPLLRGCIQSRPRIRFRSFPHPYRNPCDAIVTSFPIPNSFISHIHQTPCPKFKAALHEAEYPLAVVAAVSAPEVVVVEAADLQMPTTQTSRPLRRAKLEK